MDASTEARAHRLSPLLTPKSIALVGASPRIGSVGNRAARALLESGFAGTLALVNPRHSEIEGHTCVGDLSDLDAPPDLAILNVGAARLEATLESAIAAGARAAVIFDACHGTAEDGTPRLDRLKDMAREARSLARLRDIPAETRDGQRVTLDVNLELPREVPQAALAGAEGVGLLRTEFLYMNRDDLPGEDEQYAALAEIVTAMEGRPVTVRTLDVGGEKLASSLGDHLGESQNPALGLRAIRLSLKEPKLLRTQLAAMLRAGVHGPLRILLPMISSPAEVAAVRKELDKTARRLRRRGVAIADPLPPLGVMIEVPGAALAADSLAQNCDFFAIGTNDLTMYTLAIDRGEEQVAYLYNPLHPAVLRLIQFSVEAALRARIPVSVCGEMAGDPRFTALLVGLGVRELSMSAKAIPRVKSRILGLDMQAAGRRARIIMDQVDSGRIAMLVDDFNDAGA